MWSELYPRLTPTELEELRKACAKVDLIGQLIGSTKTGATPLILSNLAEVFQAMSTVIERADRRLYEARRKRGRLTPEERAEEQARLNPQPETPEISEEG